MSERGPHRTNVASVVRGLLLALLLAPAFAGCAATAPAARDTTVRDTTRGRGSVVPADSLPSGDAQAVLRTIPEPIAPDAQVPPPSAPRADSTAARRDSTAVRPDTTVARPAAIATPADTTTAPGDTASVPTPAPTAPLGEAPGSLRRAAAADSAAAAGAIPGSGRPTSAAPDTCWRLQISSTLAAAAAEAQAQRDAAESQLLIPMTIVVEQGRQKVRTRDCFDRAAADALRRRAFDSGFPDAFRVVTRADGTTIVAAPPPPAAKPATLKKPPAKKPAAKATAAKKVSSRMKKKAAR